MDNPIPGLIFGACLIIAGIVMLLSQRKATKQLHQLEIKPNERNYLSKRISRRTQVAGMILIVGIMIPLGDTLIPWQKAPGTFAIYWLIVLGLACWTALLGLGDMAATHVHSAVELNEIHRQQMELETVARKLKRSEKNGSADHES